MMDPLRQDLRFAFRQLARSPGFAALAVVMLGLGIGATTTIFSVINTLLLRPPAHVVEPKRLVAIFTSDFSGPPVGLLTTVALMASWLPAQRAASVDPMRALRTE